MAAADMIHPLALVDQSSEIGEGSSVWQFASVIRGSHLGRRANIGGCSVIDGAILGDDCSVGHGAQVHPGSRVGNGVFIGPGAILCNDHWPRIAKDGFDGAALLSGAVITIDVEDDVSIGAGAIILPGVRIGHHVMVAAGAVVTRGVPPHCLWKRCGAVIPIAARVPERTPEAA
jgi:UDP-2-acetamido-3-amino-2,3-dideoxy-glucuronate N-acetyltransferase